MCFTYIIKCKDNSLYTGYTTDIERRVNEHKSGINSKYTKARGFKSLEVYFTSYTKSQAMKLESYIKKLNKRQKINVILDPDAFLEKIDIENKECYNVGTKKEIS